MRPRPRSGAAPRGPISGSLAGVVLQPAEGILGPAGRRAVLQSDRALVVLAGEVIKDETVVDLTGTRLVPAGHVSDLDMADEVPVLIQGRRDVPSIRCM